MMLKTKSLEFISSPKKYKKILSLSFGNFMKKAILKKSYKV